MTSLDCTLTFRPLHSAFADARAVCDEMDDGEVVSVALGNAIASYSEKNTEWPTVQGVNNVMLYETALLNELSAFVGAQVQLFACSPLFTDSHPSSEIKRYG